MIFDADVRRINDVLVWVPLACDVARPGSAQRELGLRRIGRARVVGDGLARQSDLAGLKIEDLSKREGGHFVSVGRAEKS